MTSQPPKHREWLVLKSDKEYNYPSHFTKVIDIAEFTELEEKLKVAVEALEKLSTCELGRYHGDDGSTFAEYIATDALAKIQNTDNK